MVSLEWFRTFKYIYEHSSLTLAAEKLFMTQPGVSKHLNALEAHVGKKLFDRTSRKMLPTEYGKMLYTQLIAHLDGLEKAEQTFKRECNKNCLSLVIGCTSDIFRHPFLREIRKMNMYLTFKSGEEVELLDQLEKEQIHLLISDQKPSSSDHEYKLIFKERLVLVASPTLPLPPNTDFTSDNMEEVIQWMSGQPWYAYGNELKYITEYWRDNFRTTPDILARYVFSSGKDVALALEEGSGLSVLPAYLCQKEVEEGKLKILFPNAVKPEIRGYWVYKKKSTFLYELTLLQNTLELFFS